MCLVFIYLCFESPQSVLIIKKHLRPPFSMPPYTCGVRSPRLGDKFANCLREYELSESTATQSICESLLCPLLVSCRSVHLLYDLSPLLRGPRNCTPLICSPIVTHGFSNLPTGESLCVCVHGVYTNRC